MKKEFSEVLNLYLLDRSRKTNKESIIHDLILNKLPESIRESIVYEKHSYHISGSYGQGNKSEYPWVMISNPKITKSAQKGLYLVYLFRSDMKGFYLSLNQGITYYKNTFAKDAFLYSKKVASYFRSLIDNKEYLDKIDLVSKNNQLAKGYEASNIVSKYYELNTFDERQLSQDLNSMVELYNQVHSNWLFSSYDQLVENVVNDLLLQEPTGHVAKEKLIESMGEDEKGVIFTFVLQKEDPPTARNKAKVIRSMPVSKKDYPKIQKENAELGNFGEGLVFNFEEKLLKQNNIDKEVKWVSTENDSLGYDILSYEIKHGQIVEKLIEVKTTKSSKYSPFYLSSNEMSKFRNLNNYVIYRVYEADRKTKKGKFYEIRNLDDELFEIEPDNYIIKIK
jgi:hypothetical protein